MGNILQNNVKTDCNRKKQNIYIELIYREEKKESGPLIKHNLLILVMT